MWCKKLLLFMLVLMLNQTMSQVQGQVSLAENSIIYSTTQEAATFSDSTALFTIRQIQIEGNKRTRESIILRELSFEQDEQYALTTLVDRFALARRQLMNTGLFQNVIVSLKSLEGHDASINIAVVERWYIFPFPFVKVVDRNLQDWVKNQDMDLDRVNYGLKMSLKNFTGRNDNLHLNITNGYTKQVALRYEGLYLDKALKWSSNFSVAFGNTKEINYATQYNRQIAYKSNNNFVTTYLKSMLEVAYRPAIKTKHTFGIGYSNENISDTIFKISPLFSFQQNRISYPEVFYRVQHFNVDFIPYPTKGYAYDILLQKKGFEKQVNLWQLTARTSGTWPINPNYFFNLRLTGMLKLPFEQPYIMKQFIGHHNMYLQGYEDYYIDGVAGGFTKATFTRKIVNTAIHISSKKIKRLNNIPVKIYGKVYGNMGYVYNEQPHYTNSLNNRLLYSGGVGIDIILLYDLTFKIEWSVNRLGQNGIYLHNKSYL